MEIVILGLSFLGVMTFILVGVDLFSKGWESYEDKYVKGAEKTLDSMFITMPAQHLLYLSLASYAILALLIIIVSGEPLIGAILGLGGLFIPQFIMNYMKTKREEKFGMQLVDGLTTMSNALSAGLSLPQAFESVSNDMENPIKQEFRILNQELRLGTKMDTALNHFQTRMPNPDLILMNTAIMISQEVGGSLSEVFKNISMTVRERHRLEANIKAHTAQGKMQGYVLCLIPFALGGILSFMYPQMMKPLFNTTLGWMVLAVAVIMMTIGTFFISRIVKIDI